MNRILIFIFLFFPINVFSTQIGDNFEYSGYLKTEVWVKNYNDESHLSLSSFKNTFDIGMEYKLSPSWTFFFHPRYFYDVAYDIRTDYNSNFDKNQEKMGNTQRTEWLRDFYLDYISDELDIRIGKQQVAWSQADGLPFILDRVMPFDLTYYWLPDFADIRIPLWMVKVEYSPWLNSTLQFLLIPDFEASRSGPAQSLFAFKAVDAWDTFKGINKSFGGTAEETIYRPPKQFKNSRVGIRWRSMIGNLEYTLNWLYGYSTSAYTYIDSFTPIFGSFGHYKVSRRHKLMHVMGFSFNRSFVEAGLFEGLMVKGEFAYVHNEPTYYGTTGSRKLTEQTDKYTWFIGFDKNLFTNWVLSMQFAQLITDDKTWDGYQVLSSYTYGVMEKVENIITCKISTDFMHERIKPELTVIYGDDNDGRAIFKTKFEVRDNLWFTLGYFHFWGPPYGSNGMFRNNDHILSEIKYTF